MYRYRFPVSLKVFICEYIPQLYKYGWGACGECSGIQAKDHKSHLYIYDFSTLRPSFEADFLFLKFCFNGEKDEKNCFDVGDCDIVYL